MAPTRKPARPIVLASSSPTRAKILEAAGIAVEQMKPEVDEHPVKVRHAASRLRAEELATALAEMKAVEVSRRRPDALVIGADQVLDCDGKWYDKPGSRDVARRQLKELRGKRHRLVTAVAVASEGAVIWKHVEDAALAMRVFSDAFLDDYLEKAGEAVQGSVGGYQIEGLGAQLFNKIEGDYYAILGLPLLPLLNQLRRAGGLLS